ncbi:MAG: lysophospholipase L1-like esterase [Planctomycetaceae bacterium]|nr:lysophospholipase L1-like esterase [Planctomycetaceae bacterium]
MTPQTVIQSLIIYLFASGLAFFLGAVCVWSSIALKTISARRWMNRLAVVTCILGLIFIGLSAAPLSYWYYGIASSITLAWLVGEQSSPVEHHQWRVRLRTITALIWLVGSAWELSHQVCPAVRTQGDPPLFVIADSITAGVDDPKIITWPALIRNAHQIEIHDFSRMGAGVKAAYAQAECLPDSGGLVLIEIGGNDMLGTTSMADFEQGLERLLIRAGTHGRSVVMFEIPLPPLCNEYGRIQRRIASRHQVPLIPKRLLMGVLAKPGNTVDSIHLTQAGHNQLAALVWGLIAPAYRM